MTGHVFPLRRLSENYTELPEIGPKKSSFGTKLMSSIDKLGILNLACLNNSHALVDIKHAETGEALLDRSWTELPRLTKWNCFYFIVSKPSEKE